MKTFSHFLAEMPYLHDEELGYQVLSKLSKEALARAYSHFGKVKNIDILEKKDGFGFAAGFLRDGNLSTVVVLHTRKSAYPVQPSDLLSPIQVSMVNVSEEFAESGYVKLVYSAISKKHDIVSDHEQYLGAQGLWKSLARDSDTNIYVFDGNKKTYVKNSSGEKIKYNSKNISDRVIWGKTPENRNILLVATTK